MDTFAINVRYIRAQHSRWNTLKYYVVNKFVGVKGPASILGKFMWEFWWAKSVMWQVLLSALPFPPVSIIPSTIHTNSAICHWRYKTLANGSIVKRHTNTVQDITECSSIGRFFFLAISQNCGKRLLAFVVSVRPSICPSVCPHGTTVMKFYIWEFFETLSKKFNFSL
jgi:hypothetical protein